MEVKVWQFIPDHGLSGHSETCHRFFACLCDDVVVDGALGYGLKSTEGFEHTHLGRIGKARHTGTDQ
ncbi:DUF4260 family protein [Micromonospora sp. CA-246542]|uniref:DUF4260 family protein n=1 Tax=Micromonospora sp. CA-246542 TaxID=3239959 RepID=UPI003D8D5EF6